MSETAGAGVTVRRREGICRVAPHGGDQWHWLVTGHGGGSHEAGAAYNVTVPEGFDRTDLDSYGRERRTEADFEPPGPTLFTGVDVRHARGARLGPVTVVATAGLSNPAALPLDPDGPAEPSPDSGDSPPAGTVNLMVTTDRALAPGTRAELLASAVEAKTATLLGATGFTGTTSDAVAVGCPPAGESAPFAGSATPVGSAARACVRDALLASLDARYGGRRGELPASVAAADHGVVTDEAARLFTPDTGE